MAFLSFNNDEFVTVNDALDIAEDATGNFFKYSLGQWKRHRYDVKTLSSLKREEICKEAFALLHKGARVINGDESRTKNHDFYFICLQDHQILKALKRDNDLGLLAILVYVFTHELVHIVRFCNFFQRFDVSGEKKDREEKVVHETTFEILEDLSLPNLEYVLDSYQGHRMCDMIVS